MSDKDKPYRNFYTDNESGAAAHLMLTTQHDYDKGADYRDATLNITLDNECIHCENLQQIEGLHRVITMALTEAKLRGAEPDPEA